MIVGTKTR